RYLPSFPTRRSSDLQPLAGIVAHIAALRRTDAARQVRPGRLEGASARRRIILALINAARARRDILGNGFAVEIAMQDDGIVGRGDRKSTRLNSSHVS